MYHEHFGFFKSPFSLSPRLQFVFKSSAFEETMAHLIFGIESGESIILVTGEIGTGKTLALNFLMQNLSKTYRTSLINVTQLNFRELLKMFMAELGVEASVGADRADLLSALKAELAAAVRRGQRLLLVIDEAQNLDDATLEGVRMLTNMELPEEQGLQIILSGQPGLNAQINSPQLSQLSQRIRVHYHLDKLSSEETADYLAHRVNVAGCHRNLFRKDAIQRIHALCQGIPRLANTMADKALLAAYVDGADEVHLRHVVADKPMAMSPEEESTTAALAAQSSESPPPLVETKRSSDNARRILTRLLIILAVVTVVIAMIAHFQGTIMLPLLPGGRSLPGADQVVANEASAGEYGAKPLEIAVEDSLHSTAAGLHESLIAATKAPLANKKAADPVIVGESTPETRAMVFSTSELPVPPPGLYIHVASFLDMDRAKSYASFCADAGFPAHLTENKSSGKLWHQVKVGPYASPTEAQQVKVAILDKKIADWCMIVEIPGNR